MRKLALFASLLLAGSPVYAQTLGLDFAGAQKGGYPVTLADGRVVYLPAYVPTRPDGTVVDASASRTTAAGTSDTQAAPVQGVTGGVPFPLSPNAARADYQQNMLAAMPGVATNGSAAPNTGIISMGSDGTNARAVRTLTTGNLLPATIATTAADGSNNAFSTLPDLNGTSIAYPITKGQVFNGATWDRQRGDTVGTYMVLKGTPNLTSGPISVGTTATLVTAARLGRSRLMITQSAAGPCYYGPANTVTATAGGARLTVAGAVKTYQYAGALYGICPGGAVTVDVDEEY